MVGIQDLWPVELYREREEWVLENTELKSLGLGGQKDLPSL